VKEIFWKIDTFESLSTEALYKILKLRSQVFVVEQNAVYQDMDGKDQKALHLQGYSGDKLVAYCRLFKSGDYFDEASIGRVVVPTLYRKQKYGWLLIEKAIQTIHTELNEDIILISAQLYLKGFYESHGFRQVSEEYLEDGIPHIKMRRN